MPHWSRIRALCGRGDKKAMRAGSGELPGKQEVDVIPRKQSCRHSKLEADMNGKSVEAPARAAAVQAPHWEGDVDARFLPWRDSISSQYLLGTGKSVFSNGVSFHPHPMPRVANTKYTPGFLLFIFLWDFCFILAVFWSYCYFICLLWFWFFSFLLCREVGRIWKGWGRRKHDKIYCIKNLHKIAKASLTFIKDGVGGAGRRVGCGEERTERKKISSQCKPRCKRLSAQSRNHCCMFKEPIEHAFAFVCVLYWQNVFKAHAKWTNSK